MDSAYGWLIWALLSAVFASLTAIFAKLGVERINPDLATFFRTLVILLVLGFLLLTTGQLRIPTDSPRRSWIFLALSGLATGASWLCYFRALKLGDASRVAPVDKLSVVLVALFGVGVLGEQLSVGGWIGILLVGIGVVTVALA